MPYDQKLGERIAALMTDKTDGFEQKKMMGGLVFTVNGKMCCGTHIDKKFGDSLLMLRIGEAFYNKEINKPVCLPMDFTGRVMRGYIFVTPEGFSTDEQLDYWMDLALAYNKTLIAG